MKRSEILASQNMKAAEAGVLEWELRTTFSPMQAVLSSKDTKLGRGAGKLVHNDVTIITVVTVVHQTDATPEMVFEPRSA